jgi:Cys-rich four helix bundle protein (predicted Tat secretion target)
MFLAASAASAFADDAKPAAAGHRFTNDNIKLAMSANHCVGHGDACLQHCVDMLSTGDTSMAACAKTVREMLTACRAVGEAAARGSKFLASYAKVALVACQECEQECRKHPQMGVCLDCADACAECIPHCKTAAGGA